MKLQSCITAVSGGLLETQWAFSSTIPYAHRNSIHSPSEALLRNPPRMWTVNSSFIAHLWMLSSSLRDRSTLGEMIIIVTISTKAKHNYETQILGSIKLTC